MLKIVTLTTEEIESAKKEIQNPEKILGIKKVWYKALEKLEKILDTKLNEEILYNPIFFHNTLTPVLATVEGKMFFSTPNKEVNFDYFSTFGSKLGLVTHEKFGHPADEEEYYGMHINECDKELEFFITPEQRANLRVAHILPNELYQIQVELIKSRLRRLGEDPSKLKKYEIPLCAIETLGRMGMQRSDDIIELFKEIQENTGLSIDKLLVGFDCCSFAGLVTPPSMNKSEKYGIKEMMSLNNVTKDVALYLRGIENRAKLGRCLKYFGYKTTIDYGYKPENSVGMTWVNNPKNALENLYYALSYWEWVARHNNSYRTPEDMINALKNIEAKIMKQKN